MAGGGRGGGGAWKVVGTSRSVIPHFLGQRQQTGGGGGEGGGGGIEGGGGIPTPAADMGSGEGFIA